MPYISKAERERASWMTLREAVKHVRSIENCTVKDALRQIIAAVNDCEINAVYEDSKGQPLPPAPVLASPSGSGHLPRKVYRRPVMKLDERDILPLNFEIPAMDEASLTEEGRKALAAGTLARANCTFVVLLLRENVFKIWRGEPKVVALEKQQDTRSKGGRPSRKAEIEHALRNADLNQPDKVLIDLVRNGLGGGKGDESPERGLSDDVIRRVIAELRNPRPTR